VAGEADWRHAVERTLAAFGGLDILVNNAGIESSGYLEDFSVADYRRIFDVNVLGCFLGHREAVRAMRPGGPAGRGGSIVNLSSVAGLIGTSGVAVYSASKGAVRLLTKSAAVEFGQRGYGIRVNSIHPGLVATAMGEQLLHDFVGLGVFPDIAAARTGFASVYPIGRTGLPLDVAKAALFLASDLSSWVTGAELVVDGGQTVA
jgi:NAD(P)-dependent dehydrogenase (short-subunit alcohol dehydrogenase family)